MFATPLFAIQRAVTAGVGIAAQSGATDDDFPLGIVIVAVVLIIVSVAAVAFGFRTMNRTRVDTIEDQRAHGHEPPDTV